MLKKSVLVTVLSVAMMLSAAADRPTKKDKKKNNISVSVLDSTEAQWGRRSINDSVYRDSTVNAVYFERGRQRLPDSFKMYRATPVTSDVITSSGPDTTTITVNGREQKLPED